MKTADLEGPALEYWFSRATGEWPGDSTISLAEYVEYGGMPEMFAWAEVGPAIEREHICTQYVVPQGWSAWKYVDDPECGALEPQFQTLGRTPLIAAMRCVVMAKFGAEVEV